MQVDLVVNLTDKGKLLSVEQQIKNIEIEMT